MGLNVVHFQILYMTNEKAIGRHYFPAVRFGIIVFKFRNNPVNRIFCTTPFIIDANVAKLQIFYFMTWQSTDNASMTVVYIPGYYIADNDPAAGSYFHTIRCAHAGAEPYKDGRI